MASVASVESIKMITIVKKEGGVSINGRWSASADAFQLDPDTSPAAVASASEDLGCNNKSTPMDDKLLIF